jgi:hypothetical protein
VRLCSDGLFEFVDAPQRIGFELRGVMRDKHFTVSLNPRQPPVQRCDELTQVSYRDASCFRRCLGCFQ